MANVNSKGRRKIRGRVHRYWAGTYPSKRNDVGNITDTIVQVCGKCTAFNCELLRGGT